MASDIFITIRHSLTGMTVAGECAVCKETVPHQKMRPHILAHFKGRKDADACLVKVTAHDEAVHWLYARVGKRAKLADLDDLLRSTWVDCCGHLSSFSGANVTYNMMPDDMGPGDAKTMNVSAIKALVKHKSLKYEYDFGTPTILFACLSGPCSGAKMKRPVEIVARNIDVPFDCAACGKKGAATQVCTSCMWADKGCLLCDKCVGKHKHGKDQDPVDDAYFLPVVNSPRMGMCGYTG